jgi:hypothetical protein
MSEEQQLKVLQRAQSVFDRRKKKRTSCLIPAYYYIRGNPYRSFILDINESGAFIEVNEEFPIGQTVKLEYLNPFYRYPAKFITEIVWSRSCAIGVKFLQSYRMLH